LVEFSLDRDEFMHKHIVLLHLLVENLDFFGDIM
jgi:hypothetical protein